MSYTNSDNIKCRNALNIKSCNCLRDRSREAQSFPENPSFQSVRQHFAWHTRCSVGLKVQTANQQNRKSDEEWLVVSPLLSALKFWVLEPKFKPKQHLETKKLRVYSLQNLSVLVFTQEISMPQSSSPGSSKHKVATSMPTRPHTRQANLTNKETPTSISNKLLMTKSNC